MKKSKDEFLNRIYIKEPAEQFLKTETPEDMYQLVAHILVRINDEGTAPTPMMDILRVVIGIDPSMELEDVFPPDKEPIRRNCLVGCEGRKWLPLFTDVSELNSLEDRNVVEDTPIKYIIERAFYDSDVDGLMINPYTDALALNKEMLGVILTLLDDEDFEAC